MQDSSAVEDYLTDDNAEGLMGNTIYSIQMAPQPELYDFLRDLLAATKVDVASVVPVDDHVEEKLDHNSTWLGSATFEGDPRLVRILLDAGAQPLASYGEAMRNLITASQRPRAKWRNIQAIAIMLLQTSPTLVALMRPSQVHHLFGGHNIWSLLQLPLSTHRALLKLKDDEESGPVLAAAEASLTTALGRNLARYVSQAA